MIYIFRPYYIVNSILPRRHVNKIFQARQTNEYFTQLPRSLFSLLTDGIVDILSRSLVFLFRTLLFLSDEGPTLETLDYTIRIGSTPSILYFDLYLYSAYAAHYVYRE